MNFECFLYMTSQTRHMKHQNFYLYDAYTMSNRFLAIISMTDMTFKRKGGNLFELETITRVIFVIFSYISKRFQEKNRFLSSFKNYEIHLTPSDHSKKITNNQFKVIKF